MHFGLSLLNALGSAVNIHWHLANMAGTMLFLIFLSSDNLQGHVCPAFWSCWSFFGQVRNVFPQYYGDWPPVFGNWACLGWDFGFIWVLGNWQELHWSIGSYWTLDRDFWWQRPEHPPFALRRFNVKIHRVSILGTTGLVQLCLSGKTSEATVDRQLLRWIHCQQHQCARGVIAVRSGCQPQNTGRYWSIGLVMLCDIVIPCYTAASVRVGKAIC